MPFDCPEVDLHDAGDCKRLQQSGLDGPREQNCKHDAARRPAAWNEICDQGGRSQHDEEDKKRQAVDDKSEPGGILEHRFVILGVKHQPAPGRSPHVVRICPDRIGEDDFIDETDGNAQEGLGNRDQLPCTGDRQKREDAPHQARDCAQHTLYQLVDAEKHTGLHKPLRDFFAGVGNLRPPARHLLAVEQLDQNGNVPGLDDIENVFSQQIHHDRDCTESDDAAPGGGRCLEIGIAEPADAPADAGADTRCKNVGNGSSEIDRHAQDDERQCLKHQA